MMYWIVPVSLQVVSDLQRPQVSLHATGGLPGRRIMDATAGQVRQSTCLSEWKYELHTVTVCHSYFQGVIWWQHHSVLHRLRHRSSGLPALQRNHLPRPQTWEHHTGQPRLCQAGADIFILKTRLFQGETMSISCVCSRRWTLDLPRRWVWVRRPGPFVEPLSTSLPRSSWTKVTTAQLTAGLWEYWSLSCSVAGTAGALYQSSPDRGC